MHVFYRYMLDSTRRLLLTDRSMPDYTDSGARGQMEVPRETTDQD